MAPCPQSIHTPKKAVTAQIWSPTWTRHQLAFSVHRLSLESAHVTAPHPRAASRVLPFSVTGFVRWDADANPLASPWRKPGATMHYVAPPALELDAGSPPA